MTRRWCSAINKALRAVQNQLADVSGDVLVVSESHQQLTAEMAELKRQQKGCRQQPPSAAGDHSSKVSALEVELAAYKQKLEQMEGHLAEARTAAAAAQRVLDAACLSVESDGKDMQEALSKGAQAWVEQQQMRDELKQLQQRLTRSEAHSSEQDGHISATRTSLGQLKQQAGLQASQVKFVVWAPTEYGPARVMNVVASAAGVSIKAFTGGHNAFTPKPTGSTGRQAAGSSGGSAAGAGGDSGGSSGSGAAGGSGQQQRQQQRGSGRQQLSLYVIQLSHQRYLPICLGGKCRMVLSGRQLPVYVDAALTDEERAERRRLAPLVQELRAKQVHLRWKGAKLEQQVARASGGKQWREVDPLPPAPAEDAAGQMAGGGVGEGQ
jgi:predicted  nucleic acid-binding Zn-ribbon protein